MGGGGNVRRPYAVHCRAAACPSECSACVGDVVRPSVLTFPARKALAKSIFYESLRYALK